METTSHFTRHGRVLLLALSTLTALRAQTYEQVAPQPVPADKAPAALPAVREAVTAPAPDRVLVPVLRGLVFRSESSHVQPTGVTHDGIDLTETPLLDTAAFKARLAAYLGQPFTIAQLQAVTREAVAAMRAVDRPVVDVMAPEQNVQNGVVQIVVVTAKLGQVKAEGNKWFSSDLITSAVRARSGDEISASALMADVGWLNQNPFRRVDVVFAPGAESGHTDLTLRTEDRFPLRVYAGYENSGTPVTDENRVIAGANWGNAFGLDQQLNYQLTASPDFSTMVGHSANWSMPLPWRHTLSIFGSYTKSKPEIPMFDLTGTSWQMSGRYEIPLKAWRGWEQSLNIGLDFKRSNNDLGFGGVSVFAQATDIVQALVGYEISRADKSGRTSGDVSVIGSPGGIGSRNDDEHFSGSRAGAKASYAYMRIGVERTTNLPSDFSWFIRGEGQLSTGNLLGSEQLGFGGAASLRGYEEREVNGDGGAILVNELRGPGFAFGKGSALAGEIQPLVFIDAGVAMISDPLPGENKNTTLASSGAGVRFRAGTHVIVKADYGWQLKDSGVPTGRHGQVHVSGTLAW